MGFGSGDDKTKLAENIGASDYLLFSQCNSFRAQSKVKTVEAFNFDQNRLGQRHHQSNGVVGDLARAVVRRVVGSYER